MSEIASTVVGIAQGITRRKQEYLDLVAAADREYEVVHERFVQNTAWSIVLRAGWTVVKIILLGALGILISKTLAPFVPTSLAHQTGTRAPSALITFITLIIGGWIGYKANEFSRASMEGTRNWRKQEARILYNQGRKMEFQQNWRELVEGWEAYTGRKYESVPFFEMIIEDDLKSDHLAYINNLRAHQRTMVTAICEQTRRVCGVVSTYVVRKREAA